MEDWAEIRRLRRAEGASGHGRIRVGGQVGPGQRT